MKVAAIQMVSTSSQDENLETAGRLIEEAVSQGARFIALPEDFSCLPRDEQDRLEVAEIFGDGKAQHFLSREAKRHSIYLLGGTVPLQMSGTGKLASAALLYNPDGVQASRYDKMHLFDVEVDDAKRRYSESRTTVAGTRPGYIFVGGSELTMGVAICYDLRFPELFRQLNLIGCRAFVVPSAFTEVTGAKHWEVLVRARAIENLSYVIAPNQGGSHTNGRETYGHSMIVNPWGEIVAECTRGEAVLVVDLDFEAQDALRESFPVLNHRKI